MASKAVPAQSSPLSRQRPAFRLPRPTWVPDSEVSQCVNCNSPFTSLNRRHHCRQCGNIFCKNCCSRKMQLPQFGHEKAERVCERCMEAAFYVSYAAAESATTQITGARRLADLAKKEGGLHKVVNLGGLDAIIYLCGSYVEEVMTVAVGSLETIALHEEVQNTLVAKGALVVLFRICTSSNITNLTALNSVASVLFTLSRNGDLCRHIVAENGLHPLMALCSRTLASFQTTPKDQQLLGDVQSLGARAISYLAMNQVNQVKIIEDKKNGLDQLLQLLSHPNPNVRKYVAKTFAYLSLRNDRLKTRILRSDGTQALVSLLRQDNLRETLSHASCTIANLATNGDTNEALLNHGRLVTALCELSASMTDDMEIQRHIIRGLANFALYDSNKAALIAAVPEIVRLGKVPSAEIQRHAIRAIDNLLNNPGRKVLEAMHENNVVGLLDELSRTATANADIKKRAAAALARLQEPVDDDAADGAGQDEEGDEAGERAARDDDNDDDDNNEGSRPPSPDDDTNEAFHDIVDRTAAAPVSDAAAPHADGRQVDEEDSRHVEEEGDGADTPMTLPDTPQEGSVSDVVASAAEQIEAMMMGDEEQRQVDAEEEQAAGQEENSADGAEQIDAALDGGDSSDGADAVDEAEIADEADEQTEAQVATEADEQTQVTKADEQTHVAEADEQTDATEPREDEPSLL